MVVIANKDSLQILNPQTQADWTRYFELRWLLLRAPWKQPKGSERDEYEQQAFHILVKAPNGAAVGVGRIHKADSNQCQIRYMAVLDEYCNQGVGSMILARLELRTKTLGISQIVLNARESAVQFYLKKGYRVVGDAHTLFASIKHKKMCKFLWHIA